MKRILFSIWAVMMLLTLSTEQSFSIPAFARKYKTSCQTCHNGFPKLNAFGDAFRRNGYQFPAGTDPEYTKEEPVSLGSEGNKKAFPDAIWPGSLPGSSPISLFMSGEADYNPKTDPRFSFDGLGSSIEAVAAGTLGEDISFWGHAILSNHDIELNRIFLIFSNVVGDNLACNVKVGVFEPGLFSFSTHRAWMEQYWLTTRTFNDTIGWSIEEIQKGIEVNGIFNGRFGYNVGVVEGYGSLHADKDVYGHLTYKINGLPLDGVTEGGAAVNNSQPYIDNSLTLGIFGYSGNMVPDTGITHLAPQSNKFNMVGGDANAYYDRYNLFGGVGIRNDDQPFIGNPSTSATTTVWFTELDAVVYPWLLPGIRFESWNSHMLNSSGTVVPYTDVEFVPGIVALVRPNVKVTLKTTIEKFDSRGDTKYDFGQVSLAMAVGI
ncbi:MAG: hypothetical protein ACHQQQ_02775 [Bacteroidota bacterium]